MAVILTVDWSAGNSTFTSVYEYERGTHGVDPLYPKMWNAEDVTVSGGRLVWGGVGDYDGAGIDYLFAPGDWDGTTGSIEVEYTPNADVLNTVAPGLFYVPLIQMWRASGVKTMYFSLDPSGSRGNPYNWDIGIRNLAGTYTTFGGSAGTFVAGTPYTFKVEWQCGTPTGAPITSVASDGWVKWYLNGVLIHEELNFPVYIDDANANSVAYVGLATDITHGGSGLFGSMGAHTFTDSIAPTPIEGSSVFGVDGTVSATRAVLFSLDGATNTNSTPGLLKIAGDLEVTGTTTLGTVDNGLDALNDVTITSATALDVLAYNGSAWVNSAPVVRYAEVALTSPEILALRATPKTLVAAVSGKVHEFIGAVLLLDATATAFVESAANLAVRYTGTSGVKVSEDIEATGFIDQTTDTLTTARPRLDAIVSKSGCENQALVLHNLGAGEYTTGTGVMRVKLAYRTHATGW